MPITVNVWPERVTALPTIPASPLKRRCHSRALSTTTGSAAVCFTASNYAHTTAGRAHQSGGYALANGSNQNMGLWNTFVTTTLKQTAANYYVIGTCP